MKNIFKISKKNIYFLVLFLIMTFNFCTYFLGSNREVIGFQTFSGFQKSSENLVLSKIYKSRYFNKSPYGLTTIYINGEKNLSDEETTNQLNYALKSNIPIKNTTFSNYTSSFGLQGHITSFLYNKLNIPLTVIKLLITSLLSIILISISYLIYQKYSKSLGTIFYLTFLLSPWIVAFARNLFWVEFTWFLPGLLGLMLSKNYNKNKIYVPLIFLSILLKCLCGYEYISTIMLFTVSFFVVDFFITKDKKEKKKILKTTFMVSVACLLGFFAAITIHAFVKSNGNGIISGYKLIYNELVAKRTIFANDIKFENLAIMESLKAGIFETLIKYFNWYSKIVPGIPADYFNLMILLALICAIIDFVKKEKNAKRNLIMYVFFFITTISWFVLAKGHSYIHIHMNYVLWYFGFIQICLYLIFKSFCKFIKYISKKEIN